jgi:hypothetical protein
MESNELESPENWACKTFAAAELGDPRRTDRLVQMAAALAEEPAASLPEAMRDVSETIAAYRFLNTPQIRHEQIMQPHWQQTQQLMQEREQVLLIADATAHHPHDASEHDRTGSGGTGRAGTWLLCPHGPGGRCPQQAGVGLRLSGALGSAIGP